MNKDNIMYLAIMLIYLLALLMSYALTAHRTPKSMLQRLADGTYATVESSAMQQYLEKNKTYNTYRGYLDRLIKLTYDAERTPESVMKYQVSCIAMAIGVFVFLAIIVQNIFLALVFAGTLCFFAYLPIMTLRSNYQKKLKEFDENLPAFLNNMLMSLQSGAILERAMELAISSLDGNIFKNDLLKLLADIHTYTSDAAEPYLQLAKRVPTKDCQRFCNMVVSGLKNGNQMSDILKTESNHLNSELITKIKERGEKNQVTATAISSGLVFMPMIVILIAPMMINTMGGM